MGFETDSGDSESDEPEANMLFESDLLSSLGVWMDKLCEGTLPRIRVDEWPLMK